MINGFKFKIFCVNRGLPGRCRIMPRLKLLFSKNGQYQASKAALPGSRGDDKTLHLVADLKKENSREALNMCFI